MIIQNIFYINKYTINIYNCIYRNLTELQSYMYQIDTLVEILSYNICVSKVLLELKPF